MTSDRAADVATLRREYADRGLTEEQLGADPVEAFTRWLDDAVSAGLYDANGMVVSTAGGGGEVSARMVLLKGVDADGFVFYTNYESRKAGDLLAHPQCALLFPWHALERQVRVEGTAERLRGAESDAYFESRPRVSQLGAWASPQSKVVDDREELEDRYAYISDRFEHVDSLPRPPRWGGYRVRPHLIEFWQGRPGRMHDRIVFERLDAVTWSTHRLAP